MIVPQKYAKRNTRIIMLNPCRGKTAERRSFPFRRKVRKSEFQSLCKVGGRNLYLPAYFARAENYALLSARAFVEDGDELFFIPRGEQPPCT